MAYISDRYSYDIFISYARIDNQRDSQDAPGWVSYFHDRFQDQIRQKLGSREDIKIYFDEAAANYTVSDFEARAKQSALFLVIASPSYFDPRYVSVKELDAFLSQAPAQDRLFVAECMPLPEPQTWPAALQDTVRDSFTRTRGAVTRPLSVVAPAERDVFIDRMWDLVEKVARKLLALRQAENPGAAPGAKPVANTGRNLLLCQVTEDLVDFRDQIARYLRQFNINVLPVNDYPTAGEAFRAQYMADVARADVVVQLLGPLSGRVLSGMDAPYPQFQADAARQAGKQLIQWRRPDLDLTQVTDRAYLGLLTGGHVLSTGLEEFKQHLKNLATRVKPQVQQRPPSLVFINADQNDLEQARMFGDAFERLNAPIALPLYAETGASTGLTTQAVRSDLEENLKDCDVLLFICRNAPAEWMRGQLRQYTKLTPQRDRQPRVIAICFGSAESRNRLSMNLPNVREIIVPDWSSGPIANVAQELLA